MSNFPPPPPQGNYPPPPNYGQMPPGGGYPQPAGYGMAPVPPRTSGAAIGSLVCGLLGCIPFVTSLVAVILGFVGLRATSRPGVSGRGLAIAGLILGLLGILGWVGGSVFLYWGMGKFKELAAQEMQPFVNAIVSGDMEKAATFTSMSEAQLTELRAQVGEWGTLDAVSISGFNSSKINGRDTVSLKGTATFSKAGGKSFEVFFDDGGGAGKLRVVDLKFQ
jgi:hypothetical protein